MRWKKGFNGGPFMDIILKYFVNDNNDSGQLNNDPMDSSVNADHSPVGPEGGCVTVGRHGTNCRRRECKSVDAMDTLPQR